METRQVLRSLSESLQALPVADTRTSKVAPKRGWREESVSLYHLSTPATYHHEACTEDGRRMIVVAHFMDDQVVMTPERSVPHNWDHVLTAPKELGTLGVGAHTKTFLKAGISAGKYHNADEDTADNSSTGHERPGCCQAINLYNV